MLGILTSMPSIVLGKDRKYPPILQRIHEYQRDNVKYIDSLQDNVYLKLRFNVEKRNATLWLIPSVYRLAKGEKQYIRESYNKVLFHDEHKYELRQQLVCGTIHHRAMPTLLDLLTPNLYDEILYENHILSPFNRYNYRYYRYSQREQKDSTTRLDFHPRIYNTQLINGYAIVETHTGRIIRTVLNGEYDMISFRTEIHQGDSAARSLMPARCSAAAVFRFGGNRIASNLEATYQNPYALPDTLPTMAERQLMDSIRPVPLSESDKQIYAAYDEREKADKAQRDSTPRRKNFFKDILWDAIGNTLVTPIAAETNTASFSISPILNPSYVSWSQHRGLRYKMKLYTRLAFNQYRYLTLEPSFGYNFKFNEFYFEIPLRMTYNPKRNGYAEIVWANGNRISNGSVAEALQRAHKDSLNFDNTDIDTFTDNNLRVFNNIMLFDWIDIETGFVFHHRTAIDKDLMRRYNMPTEYHSFAPMFGLKILPWPKGPLFSLDWERAIKGVFRSSIDYELLEFDASWKMKLHGMRKINMRAGYGVYTRKAQDYFVDFTNFRQDNLPEGWDDEWSGDFELLSGSIYNESNYYVRANFSYESPMMAAKWVPYFGKYIEKERFYFSTAIVRNSRPYFELGYSFTNRYFSVGAFASFLNTEFQRVGFDFEFELFRRW